MLNDLKKSKSKYRNDLVGDIMSKLDRFGEEDVLFKKPDEMGLKDVMERMKIRTKEKNSVRKQAMLREEQKHFERLYGNDPVSFDETGKMIQPKPKWVAQHNPKPTCPNGMNLEKNVENLVHSLPKPMKGDPDGFHLKKAVKGFQSGLNILSSKEDKMKLPLLKEDSIFGPKTVKRLKRNLLEQGSSKTAEIIAIGQLKEILKKVRRGKSERLSEEMKSAFSPLLPSGGFVQPEGIVLQDTINDLSPKQVAPLKDDGVIGPKTRQALVQTIQSNNDETFIRRFAQNIGFID